MRTGAARRGAMSAFGGGWRERLVSAVESAGERLASGAEELAQRANRNIDAAAADADGADGEQQQQQQQGQQGQDGGGAKPQVQYVRIAATSAQKLRFYNHADLAALVALHTREKLGVAAENSALRAALTKALEYLPEDAALDEEERQALIPPTAEESELAAINEADDGANRVLLLAANAEIQRLRALAEKQALMAARESASQAAPTQTPAPAESGGVANGGHDVASEGGQDTPDGSSDVTEDGRTVGGAADAEQSRQEPSGGSDDVGGTGGGATIACLEARLEELERQLTSEKEAKLQLASAVAVAEDGQHRAEEAALLAQQKMRESEEAAEVERQARKDAVDEKEALHKEKLELAEEVKSLTPIADKVAKVEASLASSREAAERARQDRDVCQRRLAELGPAADAAGRVEQLFAKSKEATLKAKEQRDKAREEARAAKSEMEKERKRALAAEAAHAALVARLAEGLSDAADASESIAAEQEKAAAARQAASQAIAERDAALHEGHAIRDERDALLEELRDLQRDRESLGTLRERLQEAARQRDAAEASAMEATRRAAAADVALSAARDHTAAADAELASERRRRAEIEAELATSAERIKAATDAAVVADTARLEVEANLETARASERRALLKAAAADEKDRDDEEAVRSLAAADSRAAQAEGKALEASLRVTELENRVRALTSELRESRADADAAKSEADAANARVREAAGARPTGLAAEAQRRTPMDGVDLVYLRNTLLRFLEFETPAERTAMLPVLGTLLQLDKSGYDRLTQAAASQAGATSGSWWGSLADSTSAYLPASVSSYMQSSTTRKV